VRTHRHGPRDQRIPGSADLNDDQVCAGDTYEVAIDSDAHSTVHLPFIRYGVGTAQRGWLTAEDVVNTWPLRRLRSYLSQHRQAQKSARWWLLPERYCLAPA
jgi:hypothetical protein